MEENMASKPNRLRADRVKQERLKRGWPQGQLADIADVSLRTVQRLEKDGIAALETLKAIASAFEVDVEFLTPASKSFLKSETSYPDKEVQLLPRLKSGKDVTTIIGEMDGEDLFQPTYDGVSDKKKADLIADFFGLLGHIMINWNTFDHALKVHVASNLSDDLKKLEDVGLCVFGIRRRVLQHLEDPDNRVGMSTIFVVPSDYPKIVKNEKSNIEAVPVLLSTFARYKPIDPLSRRPFDDLVSPQNISQP
jgi:transcriptional regulator with XRE-family HTH domain